MFSAGALEYDVGLLVDGIDDACGPEVTATQVNDESCEFRGNGCVLSAKVTNGSTRFEVIEAGDSQTLTCVASCVSKIAEENGSIVTVPTSSQEALLKIGWTFKK